MEPVWMNSYQCTFDRSFEKYVDQLPIPEDLTADLQQRRTIFCWLYTPVIEEVMLTMGESTKLEVIGASYTMENGSPVQNARYYRVGKSGNKDFIMVTEDGLQNADLSFEEMIQAGVDLKDSKDLQNNYLQ